MSDGITYICTGDKDILFAKRKLLNSLLSIQRCTLPNRIRDLEQLTTGNLAHHRVALLHSLEFINDVLMELTSEIETIQEALLEGALRPKEE